MGIVGKEKGRTCTELDARCQRVLDEVLSELVKFGIVLPEVARIAAKSAKCQRQRGYISALSSKNVVLERHTCNRHMSSRSYFHSPQRAYTRHYPQRVQ